MILKAFILGAAAAATAVMAAPEASAGILYFDGFDSVTGTPSGSDAFSPSNPWSWSSTTWSYSGTYNPTGPYTGPANDFEIAFDDGVTGIAAVSLGGDISGWTTVLDGPSVAISGVNIVKGDSFSITITTIGPADYAGITASWTEAVPEPRTWAMMALGFVSLAFAGYRARRSPVAIA